MAVKKLSNVSLLSIPFILIAFAVLMLYLFGITGNLEVGYYLCIGAAIVSGAYACTLNRKISFSVDEVVGILIALIPFIWLYISIDSDFLFTGWDEFSFWGASIKSSVLLMRFTITGHHYLTPSNHTRRLSSYYNISS